MAAHLPTLDYEETLWNSGFSRVAGIDEAGRGAWAGPVCAAAVILPPDPAIIQVLDQVRDSKLMTPLARETWAPRIRSVALSWGVDFASSLEIDSLGILPATKLAATRALMALASTNSPTPTPPAFPSRYTNSLDENLNSPDYLLTDYLVFPEIELPQTALVKGDRLSLSVAAASILAKTSRDALMCSLDGSYPGYAFARHKGYGTQLHRRAIQQLGLCVIHRKSFSLPHNV
jgi:ribonuclease HII